jgi:hypothetical protein
MKKKKEKQLEDFFPISTSESMAMSLKKSLERERLHKKINQKKI